jgi:hypothetical protein
MLAIADSGEIAMHHILCVHGLGKHTNDWTKSKGDGDLSFKTLMKQCWEAYESNSDAFTDVATIHSIHYDDEINKIFRSWVDEADKLVSGLVGAPLLQSEAAWFVDTIEKAKAHAGDNNALYTHMMDLLLFVGSPAIQDRLITYVGKQVAEFIAKNAQGNEISIIGHSMGTAVLHKVIKAYFNEGVIGGNGIRQTAKGDFYFDSVSMVANVSYALSRDKESHYQGIAKPSSEVGKGASLKWFNINHRFDPVGQFLPFDHRQDEWLDPVIESLGFFRDIELTRITSKSIHSINHYFRDPRVHVPFFNVVLQADISQQELNDAVKQHEELSIKGGFSTLRSSFKALDARELESFKEFYCTLKACYQLIKNY